MKLTFSEDNIWGPFVGFDHAFLKIFGEKRGGHCLSCLTSLSRGGRLSLLLNFLNVVLLKRFDQRQQNNVRKKGCNIRHILHPGVGTTWLGSLWKWKEKNFSFGSHCSLFSHISVIVHSWSRPHLNITMPFKVGSTMLKELDKLKMSGDSKLQVYITILFYYSNFPVRQITSQINFPGRVADLVCPGIPVHLALLLASRFLLPAPTPMGDVLRPQVRSSVSSSSSSPLSPPSLPTGGSSRSPHHLRPYTPCPLLICLVDLVSW